MVVHYTLCVVPLPWEVAGLVIIGEGAVTVTISFVFIPCASKESHLATANII